MENNSLSAYICEVCEGSGKISGKDCKNCEGSGYLARDNQGNIYYVKVQGENLVVSSIKTSTNTSEKKTKTSAQDNNIIVENSSALKLVGNIFFGIFNITLIFITILFLRDNFLIYLLIILFLILWGMFNIVFLPEKLIAPFKKNFISVEEPKDLHWAIDQIKRITTES